MIDRVVSPIFGGTEGLGALVLLADGSMDVHQHCLSWHLHQACPFGEASFENSPSGAGEKTPVYVCEKLYGFSVRPTPKFNPPLGLNCFCLATAVSLHVHPRLV